MSSGESPSIPKRCRCGNARESGVPVIKTRTIGRCPAARKARGESRSGYPPFLVRFQRSSAQAITAMSAPIAIKTMPE